MNIENDVRTHYTKEGLLQRILDGAEAAGLEPGGWTPESLAPVDEFHTAGRLTTLRALAMTPFEAGMHILDAGCGIGGTARCVATECQCEVTGLDLTPVYVDAARTLSERMGLAERCRFDVGSVLDMPYANDSFDGALSFHAAMNIERREQFYAELARVMRAGAPLCLFDVMKGPGDGMRYPVPWAESADTSFLETHADTVALLHAAGFVVSEEENLRDFAIDFFRKLFESSADQAGPPPLGLHLLTGANAAEKFANYAKALDDHQIEPVIVVATRQ